MSGLEIITLKGFSYKKQSSESSESTVVFFKAYKCILFNE